MKEIILKRLWDNGRETVGVLILEIQDYDVVPFALTLEKPWFNNQQNISCIPVGLYLCQKIVSPKFGQTYEVTKVPGRTNIVMHGGDTTKNTQGCILVGLKFGGTTENMLDECKEGLKRLFDLVNENKFMLKITGIK